jgi:hypothetical protein
MTRTYADRVQAHIDKLHEFATNPSTPVTLPDQLPWALSRSNPRAPLLVDDVDRLLPGIYDRTDCRPPQVVDPHRPPSEWVTDRNPGGSQDPGLLDREGNCPDCVRASEATWRGLDMQAGANTLPYPHVEPARVLAEWSPGDVVDGDFAAIGDELLRRGPGSSAVVIVDYPDSTSGHAFNAFNDRGDVVAVDGQSGRWEPWPPTQDGLGFSEDDFESVRTILIDADGNHLRIDDLGGDPDVGRPPPDPVPAVDTMGDPPFRVLAGDLVSDRELSTGEQAEAMQAMVEVFENRVFGDGFTTRVGRTWFDPERTRMGFRVDILRNGEEAGAVHQEVTRDNGVLVALQSGVRVHAAFRGQGFATGWNRYLESWYRSSGVDNIRLLAMWDGAYFWARSGYRWTVEREARSILEKLCSHVEAVGGTPGEVSAAQDILDRAKQFPWGHEQFPTVAEIAEIGRLERPGQHLGKQFLTGTGWHGRKDLR